MPDETPTRAAGRLAKIEGTTSRAAPATERIAEDAVRLRAYQKWEAAGKPVGDGVQFWLAAETELAQHKSRTRRWWTHIRPWIVPARLRLFQGDRPLR
jgi:hypothetical protein